MLIAPQPYRAYAMAAQAFYPEPAPTPGIAPTAIIDASATLGEGCAVGPNAVIGPHVEIGKRCSIGANTVIGAAVVLGDDVRIGVNATLSHCIVGARVRIYTGVRIGQDGFGFAPDPDAPVKVPQLGRVIVGDDVEIGANTTIDRGAGPDTIIGPGTMIDNLVQIGHNVQIGRGCVLVSQVGISGSTQARRLRDDRRAGRLDGAFDHRRRREDRRPGRRDARCREGRGRARLAGDADPRVSLSDRLHPAPRRQAQRRVTWQ